MWYTPQAKWVGIQYALYVGCSLFGVAYYYPFANAMGLGALMRTLAFLRKPTIARVHGAAFGGGVGLVACCDIAVGVHGATFALSVGLRDALRVNRRPNPISAVAGTRARRAAKRNSNTPTPRTRTTTKVCVSLTEANATRSWASR